MVVVIPLSLFRRVGAAIWLPHVGAMSVPLTRSIYKEFYLEKCTNLPLKPIFPTVASSGSRPSSLVESNFLPVMTRN